MELIKVVVSRGRRNDQWRLVSGRNPKCGGGQIRPLFEPETIPRAQVLPDPAYPGKLALFVWGTKFADDITFAKSGAKTGVTVGGASLGAFGDFDPGEAG